jgi:hypothetical protein
MTAEPTGEGPAPLVRDGRLTNVARDTIFAVVGRFDLGPHHVDRLRAWADAPGGLVVGYGTDAGALAHEVACLLAGEYGQRNTVLCGRVAAALQSVVHGERPPEHRAER